MIIDGGSRGRAAAARQEQLADRLVALFLARGFKDLTLDQIAAELRCSKATLYRMAESREQLIRAIVVRYFRLATLEVDRRLVPAHGARERIAAYLLAIAEQLKPATEAFMNDVADFPPAREVYERNTRIAARRIAELIADGVAAGEFREVNAAFVADVVTTTMARIQDRSLTRATGLDDAAAYLELLTLVSRGIST